MDPALAALADERFVSLSTFRRDGTAVPTAVWIARDGETLVVTTPKGSGKVKRLRNDPRVTLRPCNRRGTVPDGAPTVSANAEVVADDDRYAAVVQRKYRLEFRIVMTLERLRRKADRGRVILRITS